MRFPVAAFSVCISFLWSFGESLPSPSSSSSSNPIPSTKKKSALETKQPKKRRKTKLETTSTKTSPFPTSSSKTTFIRRIQNEWKTIVQSGMAFDWTKRHQPLRFASPQHVWIGPDGKSWRSWRFSFVGPSDDTSSPYADGVYHGRIVLPASYPLRPPQIQLWTASGRYQPRTDICLSASAYHPESWQPAAWNVLSIVLSLRLHMLTATPTEIGGLSCSYRERRQHARASRRYTEHSGKVMVDHANMIQQGWMAGLEWEEADEEDAAGGVAVVAGKPSVLSAVVHVVAGLTTGSFAPWVLTFGILFIVLNQRPK